MHNLRLKTHPNRTPYLHAPVGLVRAMRPQAMHAAGDPDAGRQVRGQREHARVDAAVARQHRVQGVHEVDVRQREDGDVQPDVLALAVVGALRLGDVVVQVAVAGLHVARVQHAGVLVGVRVGSHGALPECGAGVNVGFDARVRRFCGAWCSKAGDCLRWLGCDVGGTACVIFECSRKHSGDGARMNCWAFYKYFDDFGYFDSFGYFDNIAYFDDFG